MSTVRKSNARILFQLTGSIACYKACMVISKLVQAGHEVETVVTRSTLEFVGRATLEGLTGRSMRGQVFSQGVLAGEDLSNSQSTQSTGSTRSTMMDHIHLARWADLAIICPATAHTINRLSCGLADDLLGTLFLAWETRTKPYLVAPAMNHVMWNHPATRDSVEKLSSWGVEFIMPGVGNQACGEEGEGRLAEPERILSEIQLRLG